MEKFTLSGVDDFLANVGNQLGESQWLEICQNNIDRFAELTLDRQWVHTDPLRAQKLSPYGSTIAHGYYVLSLFTHFLDEILEVKNLSQVLNYSVEKMTFKSAVPVNSCIRMKVSLKNAKDLGNICKATYKCVFEIDGKQDPVAEGSIVFVYYFKEKNHY